MAKAIYRYRLIMETEDGEKIAEQSLRVRGLTKKQSETLYDEIEGHAIGKAKNFVEFRGLTVCYPLRKNIV